MLILKTIKLNRLYIQLLEHVVNIELQTLPEHHSSRLISQRSLACAYKANGQTEQVVQLLASQHTLVSNYKANGQVEKATKLLESLSQTEGWPLDVNDY